MKTYWIRNTGSTTELFLRELPQPQPNAGQMLVRMRATSLNRGDMLARIKRHSAAEGRPAGIDGSGEVVSVGPECQRFQAGRARAVSRPRLLCGIRGGGAAAGRAHAGSSVVGTGRCTARRLYHRMGSRGRIRPRAGWRLGIAVRCVLRCGRCGAADCQGAGRARDRYIGFGAEARQAQSAGARCGH